MWRGAKEDAQFLEVGIVGDDHEVMFLGKLPNLTIGRACEPGQHYLRSSGKQVLQERNKLTGEVLVEQKLHGVIKVAVLCSRSAA